MILGQPKTKFRTPFIRTFVANTVYLATTDLHIDFYEYKSSGGGSININCYADDFTPPTTYINGAQDSSTSPFKCTGSIHIPKGFYFTLTALTSNVVINATVSR